MSPIAGASTPCEHVAELRPVAPQGSACAQCVALGAKWHELRVCLDCGQVGCCEDSKHAHALAHFNATGHPMIASLEPGETWGWCYVHRRYFDPLPESLRRRRGVLGSLLDRLFGQQPR